VSFCRLAPIGRNFVEEVQKKMKIMAEDNSQKEQEMEQTENRAGEKPQEEESGTRNEQPREEKPHKEHHKAKKEKYQEKFEEQEKVIEEMKDKHLRLQAEFDNFRKRTLKEKADLIKSGGESVLTLILPVIDDFDRALAVMKDVPEDDPSKIGFLLIFNKFKDFMKINNLKEIEAMGQDFDVDIHYALTKIPAPVEELKGKVVDVVEKGYLLNDKVIRFAKVVIGE
jgi:molecular chaperone GrpE